MQDLPTPASIENLTEDQIRDSLTHRFSKGKKNAYVRLAAAALGSIPWIGGLIAGAAAFHGEQEQSKTNVLFREWMEQHREIIKRLEKTLLDITIRLDQFGEEVQQRVESEEYLTLAGKAFRTWDNADTEEKRSLVKNLLTNSAASRICSDDVVRLFIDWIDKYHEIHFRVIREVYHNPGIARGEIWQSIYGERVRDDSAEADLFRLLVRDLSTGGVIRQHRETNEMGQFYKKPTGGRTMRGRSPVMKSALDGQEPYELTQLGTQFVAYTMEETPLRLDQASKTQ